MSDNIKYPNSMGSFDDDDRDPLPDPYGLAPHDPIDQQSKLASSFASLSSGNSRFYNSQATIPVPGIFPAYVDDSKFNGPVTNPRLQVWYMLKDHKVRVLVDYPPTGHRIAQLQQVFGVTTPHLLKGRECEVEVRAVQRPPPKYKIWNVMPPSASNASPVTTSKVLPPTASSILPPDQEEEA
jgi:hypothetical protein